MEGGTVHTGRTLRMWNEILHNTKATSVLEIGFLLGETSRIFLGKGLSVHSIDIGTYPETHDKLQEFAKKYDKFSYEIKPSQHCSFVEYKTGYDLLFVDGDHRTRSVLNDIMLGVNARFKWIIVDDYDSKWFGNIIRTVDFFRSQNILKLEETYVYDTTDGENTLACLRVL